MAEATLQDIIQRLKAEGQLVRNTGTNSIRSVKIELQSIYKTTLEQTTILQQMFDLTKGESEAAERRRQTAQADTSNIAPKVGPPPLSVLKSASIDAGPNISDMLSSLKKIGPLVGALALGLGVAIGLVAGQLKAIKTLVPGFNTSLASLSKFFTDFKVNLTSKFASITTATGKILDGALSFMKNVFSLDPNSRIAKILAPIKSYLGGIVKIFTSAGKALGGIFKAAGMLGSAIGGMFKFVGQITGAFSALSASFGLFGKAIGTVGKVVGKLFAPIAIIMTVFDTIKGAIAGFKEGGILGGLKGAINGFFTSLITAPLDLIKNAVAWVLGKFGFDESSEALKGFSFTELFKKLTGAIFAGLEGVFNVVKDLFTFGEEDFTLLGGLGKLVDFAFLGINSVINFVKGIFGFDTSEEPFKLQDWIMEKAGEIFEWIGNLFSFLPSVEGLKNTLLSYLPEWMQPDSIDEQRNSISSQIAQQRAAIASGDMRTGLGRSREKIVQELELQKSEIPGFSTGTRGFVDFGVGSPAMLHGIEAVVPRNTAAGMFLANNFDKNYAPISKNIANVSTAAIQASSAAPIIIANAPTIAPVTNNVRGATNYSNQRITAMGSGSGGSGLARFAN